MILNGSLLLIDNYKSDYTLSILKLLAEYPENNSISEVLKNNPYRLIEQLQFNTKQVLLVKPRVLLKDESILKVCLMTITI